MDRHLLFKTLYCVFNAPTSTTTAESVACSFGGANGIIMKFESSESAKYIRTLDMALFARFEHEEEHLIFETRLHIKDVFIPNLGGWVGENFMNRISLFDLLIHGNMIFDKKLLKKKNQKRLLELLQSTLNGDISKYAKSSYVQSLIRCLIQQNDKIWLNVQQIQCLENRELRNMFITDHNEFGKFIMYLKTQFDVVICPIFITNWTTNENTFEFISRHENRKYKDIKFIVSGPTIKCVLSDRKTLVFQPQLTKIENIYHIQMKFISTYNALPINVHFNVECKEANNYYRSLHPRWMDVKWNNTFHVILPPINRTMSIRISMMMHNTEQFGVNYKNIASTNMAIAADMTSVAHSFTLPDILSTVYGISNTVISVADSVSDILFIIFLWQFNVYLNEQEGIVKDFAGDFGDQSAIMPDSLFENAIEEFEVRSKFLFMLSFGNLLSVAIIIAVYFTYKLQINPLWKKY
eukprot:444889_1